MALESNGLYSIEVGSKIWRHLFNYNFNKISTSAAINSTAALYSDTIHTHPIYKDRTIADGEVTTALGISFPYNIKFSNITSGIVLLDRTTGVYNRLYVDSGSLLTEVI